ncbi:hypothetical protein QUF56_17350 [Ureibacillus composti]|nr:hypothetical protein [Ureibacillus composti]
MKVDLTIKVDRSAVDKVISEMDITKNIREAIDGYNRELKLIEEREEELKLQLSKLQTKLTQNLLALETEQNVTKVIEMKKENYSYNEESKIITHLLEEIQEDIIALKIQWGKIYKSAIDKDVSEVRRYHVTEMKREIEREVEVAAADISKEISRQFWSIYHDVQEIYGDEEIQKRVHPPLKIYPERFTAR